MKPADADAQRFAEALTGETDLQHAIRVALKANPTFQGALADIIMNSGDKMSPRAKSVFSNLLQKIGGDPIPTPVQPESYDLIVGEMGKP